MERKEYTVGRRAIYDLEAECLLIHLPAEMDDDSCSQIREEARDLMKHGKVRRLIYDFAGVEFMDSAGIGVLIGRKKNMEMHNGTVLVRNLGERAGKIFEKSGLSRIIKEEK